MNYTLFKLLVGISTEEETPTVHTSCVDYNYGKRVKSELRERRTEVKQTAESRFLSIVSSRERRDTLKNTDTRTKRSYI